MKYSQFSGVEDYAEDDEDQKKDIKGIINKYELNNYNNYSENKIISNDNIENKNSDIISQYSKRTKNSSNFIDKSNLNNNIIIYVDDLNKSVASDTENKSIKSNNSQINKKDIEINIESNNITLNNSIADKYNGFNVNLNKNNSEILFSSGKNIKTENINTSIYNTSNNILFNNPYDISKIFFNANKNKTLLKNKMSSNLTKKISNNEEKQIKKEKNYQIFKNNKLKINNKNNYTNKIYKNKYNKLFNKQSKNDINDIKKKQIIKYKINNNNYKNECKCKCFCNNLINIIRGILIFLIISSTLIFYIYLFICY